MGKETLGHPVRNKRKPHAGVLRLKGGGTFEHGVCGFFFGFGFKGVLGLLGFCFQKGPGVFL